MWSALLCSLLSLLLSCGVLQPSAPTSTTSAPSQQGGRSALERATAGQRRAFIAADTLRMQGQYVQALEAFKAYVRRYPTSPLTDQALLALGALSTRLESPVEAAGYYHSLVQLFPASPHVGEAHLALGMLAYEKRQYDRAMTSVLQALRTLSSPQQRAKAQFYRGAIAHQQRRYVAAVDALKTAAETSIDPGLAQEAQDEIAAILQANLTLADLNQLAQRYATTYPGGFILLRLAQFYREERNAFEEMATLQRFMSAFPDHPSASWAAIRLTTLQAGLTTDPTKIGVLLPLSGGGKLAGERAWWGIELALDMLRARAPSLNLTLVRRDTQGDGLVASSQLRSLVNDEHVIAVIGPLHSDVATALGPLTEELSVPVISPYAPVSRFPFLSAYAFRNSLTDDMQTRFLAEYAMHVLNLRRFAVIYENNPKDPYGISLKDAFIEHVIRLQGHVVAVASYSPTTTNFRQTIKTLGDTEATDSSQRYDAIFLPGYYDRVGLLAPELALYNITGVQLLGGDGWNDTEITAIGGRFVEGAIFVDGFFASSPDSGVGDFVRQFEERYNEQPGLFAAQGCDTLRIVAQVLQAGATTREELREGLLRVRDFSGVSGLTTIDSQGNAEKVPFLLTIENGQIVQIN